MKLRDTLVRMGIVRRDPLGVVIHKVHTWLANYDVEAVVRGAPYTIPALVYLLESTRGDGTYVYRDANYALRKIAAPATDNIVPLLANTYSTDIVEEPLRQMLLDTRDHRVRECCIRALVQLQHPRAIETLLDVLPMFLDRKDCDVRACCVEVLGQLQHPRALEALLKALPPYDDGSLGMEELLSALGNYDDPRCLEALMKVSSNPANALRVRTKAAYTLGRIGNPSAVGSLLSILTEYTRGTHIKDHADYARYSCLLRLSAVDALREIGDPRALDAIRQELEDTAGNDWLHEVTPDLYEEATRRMRQTIESLESRSRLLHQGQG